jgi:hypothetical protein
LVGVTIAVTKGVKAFPALASFSFKPVPPLLAAVYLCKVSLAFSAAVAPWADVREKACRINALLDVEISSVHTLPAEAPMVTFSKFA